MLMFIMFKELLRLIAARFNNLNYFRQVDFKLPKLIKWVWSGALECKTHMDKLRFAEFTTKSINY